MSSYFYFIYLPIRLSDSISSVRRGQKQLSTKWPWWEANLESIRSMAYSYPEKSLLLVPTQC